MKLRLLILAAALLPVSVFGGPFPDLVLPQGVGINIHFVPGHARDLDMMAAAGFRFARMDFNWAATEQAKGQYDWSTYDDLTANLLGRGIRPYYIFDYSNPLYVSGNASPQHPESVAAFARWAAAAAAHFRGKPIVWEIWNEPNGGFWLPHPDVSQYTTLALATCKAVRKADSHAIIVAPASATFPWPYLETFLHSGVLAYLDGVSVHPYRSSPPETVLPDYRRLRKLIDESAPEGRHIPILSGEWGYSTKTGGVSLQTQANYAVRQQLINLYAGVPVSIWYDWSNDGRNPAENEHNFGTVTYELKPKPSYIAIQTLTHELSGYRISKRCDTGNAKDYVLALANATGEHKLAAWTLAKPHKATFVLSSPASARSLSWTNTAVEGGTVKIEGSGFTSELSGTPKFFTLRKTEVTTVRAGSINATPGGQNAGHGR